MLTDAGCQPSAEQIDALLAFLPVFEDKEFVPSVVVANPGEFPRHELAPELDDFIRQAHDSDFVFSFDWKAWREDGMRYKAQPALLDDADLLTIRQLITMHVRGDRFTEGHLAGMVSCGHIAAVLRRLKALRECDTGKK